MEPRILDFKEKAVQTLSLNELKSTVKEEDYNQNPLMGMFHYDYIEKAAEAVDKAGLNFEIDTIFAAQNRDKSRPGVSVIEKYRDEHGDGSVQSYLMRRIFARIIITTLEDDFTSTAIALSYNQLGFQLAFGPNVKICQNQSIMGADKFMSTYQHENKMPTPERMIEVLGEWLGNFEEIRKKEIETIHSFEGVAVTHTDVLEMVGDLTAKRIRRDNSKEFPSTEGIPPLNQSQIGSLTKNYMLEKQENLDRVFNAWDMYNFATNLYKPGSTDFSLLLSSNAAMSQYLMNKFNLN